MPATKMMKFGLELVNCWQGPKSRGQMPSDFRDLSTLNLQIPATDENDARSQFNELYPNQSKFWQLVPSN